MRKIAVCVHCVQQLVYVLLFSLSDTASWLVWLTESNRRLPKPNQKPQTETAFVYLSMLTMCKSCVAIHVFLMSFETRPHPMATETTTQGRWTKYGSHSNNNIPFCSYAVSHHEPPTVHTGLFWEAAIVIIVLNLTLFNITPGNHSCIKSWKSASISLSVNKWTEVAQDKNCCQ